MNALLREATRRFASFPPPVSFLQGLHGLKLCAGRAYETAAVRAPESQRAMFRRLAEHEREHAEAVGAMLGALASKKPRRPLHEDVAALAPGIADAASPHAALRAAQRLEAEQLGAVGDVVARMTQARLLQTLLTILAADGQHRAALRLALGEEPVPAAFS